MNSTLSKQRLYTKHLHPCVASGEGFGAVQWFRICNLETIAVFSIKKTCSDGIASFSGDSKHQVALAPLVSSFLSGDFAPENQLVLPSGIYLCKRSKRCSSKSTFQSFWHLWRLLLQQLCSRYTSMLLRLLLLLLLMRSAFSIWICSLRQRASYRAHLQNMTKACPQYHCRPMPILSDTKQNNRTNSPPDLI